MRKQQNIEFDKSTPRFAVEHPVSRNPTLIIFRDQGQAAYELEVEATDEEIKELRKLMDLLGESEHATYFRSMIPGIAYHHDNENDTYDYYLRQVYNTIIRNRSNETTYFVYRRGSKSTGPY